MATLNEMTPKTRTMMVISVILIFVGLMIAFGGDIGGLVVLGVPVILYWGYRFVNEGTNIK